MKLKSDLSIRSAAQLVSFALRVLEDGNLHAKEEQFSLSGRRQGKLSELFLDVLCKT